MGAAVWSWAVDLEAMKRFFTWLGAGLLMLAVVGLSAFGSMRLFLHGREVTVPNLAGKSDSEAAAIAKDLGINLSVENRFYSAAVPPNNVLSQSPVAGARVRRGWQVRVTESLGGQKVSVPDVTGQTERPASLVLRRQQLELGAVVHIPAPGPAGVVLTQSPPPNTVGLNGPRVGLLVADDEVAGANAAYVMPSLVGLTLGSAGSRLATAGLHIGSTQEPEVVAPDATAEATDTEAAPVVAPVISTSSVIVGQSPLPGKKVTRADVIRVTLGR